MYEARNLDYNPVDTTGWPPSLTCNCCGSPLPEVEVGCFAAHIIVGDGSISLLFCSAQCVERFKTNPFSDPMIADLYFQITGESLPE